MWSEYFKNVYFIEFEIENIVNVVITSVCLFHLQSFYVLMLVCRVNGHINSWPTGKKVIYTLLFCRCRHKDHQCWDFSEIDWVSMFVLFCVSKLGCLNLILWVFYISGKTMNIFWGVVCVAAGIKVYQLMEIPKFLSILSPSTGVTTSAVSSAWGHSRPWTLYWQPQSQRALRAPSFSVK